MHFLTTNNIQVAMVQETKLTSKSKDIKTPGYTLLRKDRGKDKGGGLAFLIREDITFHNIATPAVIESNPNVEHQSIAIKGRTEDLILRNIYIPPASSCQQGHNLPFQEILNTNTDNVIIGGDFNAHHSLWHSKGEEDQRGRLLADEINNSTLGTLNEDNDTRVTENNCSSPDITIATPAILPYLTWKVVSSLNSDHLPIIIQLKADIYHHSTSADKVYINFAKADWTGFTQFTEDKFSRLPEPTDSIRGEKAFRKILNEASKKFIPKGRIPTVVHNIPTQTAAKIKQRDAIRSTQPDSAQLQELNREIQSEINKHRKAQWLKHLESCEQGSQKLWKTIKGISQPTKRVENTAIKFNNKPVSENKKIVNLLNRQYTPSTSKKPTQEYRSTIRKLKLKKNSTEVLFTSAQTKKAIRQSKNSKALGPDEISPIMLKHLGDHGAAYLTKLFNATVNSAIIPANWKTGKIIPLLKPNKSIDESKSYRPISLLSPAAKILEKLILPDLAAAVNLQDHQHGFRPKRSTVSALLEVQSHISEGMNKRKPCDRTILVALDLSRAFDTVDHEQLLADILHLELSDTLKKFLSCYLRGRQQYVIFRGCRSKYRVVRQGVPQGGVLSPLLFNLYMSTMPTPPGNIRLVSYADDCQVLNSGPKIEPTCKEMIPYLDQLANWFQSRRLEISPEKSTATVFTTFSNEVSTILPITIQGKDVPTDKHPKILGVTFDGMLNFGQHAINTKTKVSKRNNVLKCLAGTNWGKSKETLVNTYKAIGRSVMNYAAPVWTPSLSKTNWEELETAQTAALRTATGCVKMAPTSHLYQENHMLPVKEHSVMLTDQFLYAMHQPEHPNHHLLHQDQRQRQMRQNISDFKPHLQPHVRDGARIEPNYKTGLKKIHDDAHRRHELSLPVNRVLNTLPPSINIKEEKELSKSIRSTLSQLRSGYSSYLNTYLHRINKRPDDLCPDCNLEEHTTPHLFQCRRRPNIDNLTPADLWHQPKKCAEFLGLMDLAPDG